MARDFDLGITGPPLSISMDFIASGSGRDDRGLTCAVVLAGYAWWAPLAARAARGSRTHWLLRESGVWRDRNTRKFGRRSAMPTTPIGSRSMRRQQKRSVSSDSRHGRSNASARAVVVSSSCAGRRRACASARSLWSLLLVLDGQRRGVLVAGRRRGRRRARPRSGGHLSRRAAVTTSMIAFGGLSWALDGASAPAAAVLRLQAGDGRRGRARAQAHVPRQGCRRARSASAT